MFVHTCQLNCPFFLVQSLNGPWNLDSNPCTFTLLKGAGRWSPKPAVVQSGTNSASIYVSVMLNKFFQFMFLSFFVRFTGIDDPNISQNIDVLNGIAWDRKKNRLFGKF